LQEQENKFIRDVAHIAGGAVKIRSNVTTNSDKSINGRTGFRDVNVRTMEGYIVNLDNILEAVDNLSLINRIRIRISKLKNTFPSE
jgi:hypothetical protein